MLSSFVYAYRCKQTGWHPSCQRIGRQKQRGCVRAILRSKVLGYDSNLTLLGRHPPAALLFHSDRGSQYTSDGYRVLLAEAGITASMSRTGNCYDNAVTESFFGTLKGECVERASFRTQGQARQAIFEYVECFYNRVRRHSSLGYLSPVAYEPLK